MRAKGRLREGARRRRRARSVRSVRGGRGGRAARRTDGSAAVIVCSRCRVRLPDKLSPPLPESLTLWSTATRSITVLVSL